MGKVGSSRWWSGVVIAFAAVLALVAPGTAVAAPDDPVAAAASVEPAVARIDTVINYQNAVGLGTGVVLSPNGEVLTNFHVVQGADSIRTVVAGRSYPAELVGYDRSRDIAVLQLAGARDLPTAPIGDAAQLTEGEPVVALGNSRGTRAPLTREVGSVTGFGRTVNAEDALTGSSEELTGLIEFEAPVRAGDSGGPVVDSSGHVVGITTAATVNFRFGPGGEGFAIPINAALAVANQIRSRTPSATVHIGPPALLGVGVSNAQQRADVPGVIVREVLRGGPARQAGMTAGDVIVAIGDARVDTATALTYALDRHYPGDVVDLVWINRAGEQISGKATLAAGP